MNKLKDCRHGRMLFNEHDVFVGRSLDLYGEYSEEECEVFRQVVKPGRIVLELGANIGAHTVVLARLVGPRGRVIAFEPQRVLFQTLCANLALNDLLNVDCRLQAVGARAGTVIVPRLDYSCESNFAGLALGEYEQGDNVAVVAVDDLELRACHFIKIDIEGMECDAIAGARKTIERCKPVLYVENDREDRSDELVRAIDDLGYALYWHTPTLFNPNNFAGNSHNIFGEIVSKNMFCIHRSIQHDVDFPAVSVPVK